ncbi:helix-turn-helix transcriptional regulator [Actinospica robiniae]|uniref:helix-turn-helix transcriptional regulator n=1 Tax=Actinospica robiniae TaxID=304901 RepID=UPI0009FFAC44|nr:LuxR family transcriptional regulator [Actinospica robiniae]
MGVGAIGSPTELLGRGRERAALDRTLATAQAGSSAVLVLRGEPGIGKTALLDYAADRAAGMRTIQVTGIESEMELPFAGLHQLCAPFLDRLQHLPSPQHDALRVAFGLQQGEAPQRFLVGLAALSLLADAADAQPLLCLVDDAQWLDEGSAQLLAFVARRLMAEPMALIFGVRQPDGLSELAGLPELVVEGLNEPEARALLLSTVNTPLDPQVRDRIVAESRGNPMALLHLPRAPGELAGGFRLPDGRELARRIQSAFDRELASLPQGSRQLLTTAAADPTGDASLLWRAAGLQEIAANAAVPAEVTGLVEFGTTVRFRHPLTRSTVYESANVPQRRAAHRALADATDPRTDPDRRAWHRACAASGPDEDVAVALEHSADRARSRGGAAATALFLRRAAELTPDPIRRVTRALAAAQAHIDAGQAEGARSMLTMAEIGPLDELLRARLERLRAREIFTRLRGGEAPGQLLRSARRLAPLDAALARDTLLESLGAAIFAGRLSKGPGQQEVAEEARAGPSPPTPPRAVDVLLDGVASRIVDGSANAVDKLRNALPSIGNEQTDRDVDGLRLAFHVLPEPIAPELWDDDAWQHLATSAVETARATGTLATLPMALTYRAYLHVQGGRFDTAAALIDEATSISQAVGGAPMMYTSLVLSAWRAEEPQASDLIETTIEEVCERGEGRSLGLAHYANSLLYNGLGRYDAALAAAMRACEYEDLGFFGWALTELIEAATRSGRRADAEAALEKLVERTRAGATAWAIGTESCSRALLSDGGEADALFRSAIEHLGRCRIAVQLARARLLYGEWLRRENRRQESRAQLKAAHEAFIRFGAQGFAERARMELLATGESVRKRTAGTDVTRLTGQETQIARLARAGHTNQEIAARLFISPRTVEWHLGNVFAKLGVSSRRQLRLKSATPNE